MQDMKMKKQKVQLNYKEKLYIEQKKNIIKNKNKLNHTKHNVGHLSASVLDLKVSYKSGSYLKWQGRSPELHVIRPQVSRQMTVGPADHATRPQVWTCVSIVTFECTSLAERFLP